MHSVFTTFQTGKVKDIIDQCSQQLGILLDEHAELFLFFVVNFHVRSR